MSFFKTAAVATLVAAAALSSTAASAHKGGKGPGPGMKSHHHHFRPLILVTPSRDCSYWLYKYKKTGRHYYLDRYYACKY